MNISEVLQLEVQTGDHLCSIYNNLEQQFSIIVPFMLHGLQNNEKCLFIVDEHTAETAEDLFRAYGLNLWPYLESGAFTFLSKEDTYLEGGYFDPDRMIASIQKNLQRALENNYSGLRVTGEMTWVFSSLPGVERLMEYEAKLNQFLPNSKVTAICQYNERKFQPDVLMDVLRTHPKVIIHGHYYENNYYEPPDTFLARLKGEINWDMYHNALEIIQERRNTLESLKESEKRHRQVVENAGDGIVVAQGGYFKFANRMALQILECSQLFLDQNPFIEFVHPEDRELVTTEYIKLLNNEKVQPKYTIRIIMPGGTQKLVEFNGILSEREEQPVGIVFFRDITEQQQSKEQLRETINYLNSILKASPDLLFRCDREGTFLDVIAIPDESILYLPPEKFLGKRILDVMPANVASMFDAAIKQALDFRKLAVISYDLEVPAGYMHFEARISMLNEQEVILLIEDITKRKHAENALRQSEEKFRLLSEKASDVIWTTDLDLNYTYISPSAKQLGGHSVEEILSSSAKDTLTPSSWEKVIPILQKELSLEQSGQRDPEQSITLELEQQCKDGTTLWVESKMTFLRDEIGQPVGILGFTRDISKRKHAEQKLTDYTAQLEQLHEQLNEEMDKARHVHERTLPKEFPIIEGISFAAHYQPAKKLGGDFYNIIQVNDKLVIYLSDVSGHGLEGALLSVFIKEAIDSYLALKSEKVEPKFIIDHLDRQYRQENFPDNYFISIFLTVLDLETMELNYTAAGFHNTPLLQQKEGTTVELIYKELPISSTIPFEESRFEQQMITLCPGTTLLFYTDGLTEQFVQANYYKNVLKSLLQTHSHYSPEFIVQAINEDFRKHNNGLLQGKDDITFLVMKVGPSK